MEPDKTLNLKTISGCYYVIKINCSTAFVSIGLLASVPLQAIKARLILQHEKVFVDKVLCLKQNLFSKKTQNFPVQLLHKPKPNIKKLLNELIEKYTAETFLGDNKKYKCNIFKIYKKNDLDLVSKHYQEIKTLLVADGHHRIMALNGIRNVTHFFSYIADSEQVNLSGFGKLIFGLQNFNEKNFLESLNKMFSLKKISYGLKLSKKICQMYINKSWYSIQDRNAMAPIMLEDIISNKLLNLDKKRMRDHIKSVNFNCSEIQQVVNDGLYQLGFILPSFSVNEIFNLAKMNILLPQHTTLFEPKVTYNLINYSIFNEEFSNV